MGKRGRPPKPKCAKTSKIHTRYLQIVSYVKCDKCQIDIPIRQHLRNQNYALGCHYRQCQASNKRSNMVPANEINTDMSDEHILFDVSDEHVETTIIEPQQNFVDSCINTVWYDFQQKLVTNYETKTNHMKINKNKNEIEKSKVEDNLAIYDFVLNHGLSNSGINDLIKLIRNISIRNNANIPLPNNYNTLHKRCCNNIISDNNQEDNQGTFDILEWKYYLDEEVLPLHQKCIYVYSYNIMQILSEALLNMDPTKFIRHPDIRFSDHSNSRIYEDYTTGDHFERLTNEIRKKNSDGVALSIGITLDDTTTRSGKRSFTPVYLYIMNAIDDAFKMILIGFAPGDKLPYSDGDITKFINEIYPNQQGKKTVINDFIRYSKRQCQIDYLYDIMKPILETQENGVKFQVGSFNNDKSFCIHAFVHICLITGDNKQLDFLAGTHFRSSFGKCRQCLSMNIHSLNANEAIGDFRNDSFMYSVGLNAKTALIDRCKHAGGRLNDQIKTIAQISLIN